MHVFFLVILIFICGCNRADPFPELQDPIYQDVDSQRRNAEHAVEVAKKEKEDAKKATETAQVQTGDVKAKWNTFFEAEKKLDKATQMLKYYELRLETRKAEDRKTYAEAFAAKKPWPDPQEYQDYLIHKKLENAPRDWGQRLKAELATPEPKTKGGEGKKKAGGGEHE